METFKPTIESQEKLAFDLVINVTRHGPKQGLDGPLSEEGKQKTEDYFSDAYDSVSIDEGREQRVVSSPKERAKQTANIYQKEMERNSGIKPVEVEIEEFLNEGGILPFYDTLSEEEQKNWFKHWYEINKGLPLESSDFKKMVRDFSSWLLKEINKIKNTGGNSDINAFSHGPLIGAVLLSLEDELGQEIITSSSNGTDRIDRKKILDINSGQLRALQNINFYINSKDPNIIKINVLNQMFSVPISIFKKFAGEKQKTY